MNIIDFHIANRINEDIFNNKFSKNAKTTTASPIFGKGDRTDIKNVRPASLFKYINKNL